MKSRRWRDGAQWRHALPTLILSLLAAAAHASCPPSDADGAVVRKDGRLLAYRPLLSSDAAKPARIPMAKHFALDVQLCDGRDGYSVSNARLTMADASMPEHKHGMNYRPVVSPLGSGRFRVEGMMFHMAGHWRLVFDVQSDSGVTQLFHDVQIE